MAHYEPPHQDPHSLQIQLFSPLVLKQLRQSERSVVWTGMTSQQFEQKSCQQYGRSNVRPETIFAVGEVKRMIKNL